MKKEKKTKEPKQNRVTINLPDAEHAFALKAARESRRSVSNWFATLIEERQKLESTKGKGNAPRIEREGGEG